MGAPSKRRALLENKSPSSSGDSSGQSVNNVIPPLDGNRDPEGAVIRRKPVDYSKPTDLKNISEALGFAGWVIARGGDEKAVEGFPQRSGQLNKTGKPVEVKLNTFNVLKYPSKPVYQYDVSWSGDEEPKRIVMKKIWNSTAVQTALGEPKNCWIYDNNKLAWAMVDLGEKTFTIEVDLDAEEAVERTAAGKPVIPRKNARSNVWKIHLLRVRSINFNVLDTYLGRKRWYTVECIDALNFLDHLMREGPSRRLTQIKKSFFQRGESRFDIGGGIEAFKGVFSSMRMVLNDSMTKGLAVNVDVANGTFWRRQELGRALGMAFGCTAAQVSARFKEAKRNWNASNFKKDLRRFNRVGVTAFHTPELTQYTIDGFTDKDCHEATFEDKDGKKVSIFEYFEEKYKIKCLSGIPVVRMTKKIRNKPVFLPVDVLRIDENQRYNSKLSDVQTSQMIKFAVTVPKDRWTSVEFGLRLLNWPGDKYLQHYELQINTKPATVKGCQLQLPVSKFAKDSVQEKDLQAGRWMLLNRTFYASNDQHPITGWGIQVIGGRGGASKEQAENFASMFIKVFKSHGGRIKSHPKHGENPWIGPGILTDGGEMVHKAWTATANKFGTKPNFMMFIVNDRNIEVYRRIKKSCDIRYGIASQVVQSKHAIAASAQYLSNVCMKVNAKLGGATNYTVSKVIPKLNPDHAMATMVIGADVSHPAPGAGSADAASFAAITMSADSKFTRYWAAVATNGNRTEMITTHTWQTQFLTMFKQWSQLYGGGHGPRRIVYIRDGVSEGQYKAVIEEEVKDLTTCIRVLGFKKPAICVVIAGKRHHLRFFPKAGDRNQNPFPGTLVEYGCTHPYESDFYLCSHVAIKGTARPIHYQVIMNNPNHEGKGQWQTAELQQFIFEHSYQYVRSTTPVSLHPAVYYAHLAADRARAHVTESPVSSGKKETKPAAPKSSTDSKKQIEVPPLQPMPNGNGLRQCMWYV